MVTCRRSLSTNKRFYPAAFFAVTDYNPHAGHQMSQEYNTYFKFNELNVFTYFLSSVTEPAHKNVFG